jgi:hypothetical protein
LGSFDSEIQAARAYDVYALKELKSLNFPCEAAERNDSDAPTIARKVRSAASFSASKAVDSDESGGMQSPQPSKRKKKIKMVPSNTPIRNPTSSFRLMPETSQTVNDLMRHAAALQSRNFLYHYPAATMGLHQSVFPQLAACTVCWRAKRFLSVSPCDHMNLAMCGPCAMEMSLESHVECPICGAPVALAVSRSMSNAVQLMGVGQPAATPHM